MQGCSRRSPLASGNHIPPHKRTSRSRRRHTPACTARARSERECRRAGGRGGISGGGTAGASMMYGADASATRRSAVPSQPRSQNWVALTPARRDDDTTLPRITGDAGLLMSTTVSELEYVPPRMRTSRSRRRLQAVCTASESRAREGMRGRASGRASSRGVGLRRGVRGQSAGTSRTHVIHKGR